MGDEYLAYLARFESTVGAIAVGAYGQFKGKMVRKLSPEEFARRHAEYMRLAKTYKEILARGDTINDALTKMVRERAIELVLEPT
jgi:hypothetical protein